MSKSLPICAKIYTVNFGLASYGKVTLHTPNCEYGRAGHAALLLTAASADVFAVPAVVERADAFRRK